MKLGNSNSLAASEYLIYNPFLVDEKVNIISRSGKIYDGEVISLSYDPDTKDIVVLIEIYSFFINVPSIEDDYVTVTYNLSTRCFYYRYFYHNVVRNESSPNDLTSESILSVISKKYEDEDMCNIRDIFQNLFECNYICRFKDTDLCDKCYNFEEFKYVDNNRIFLVGDKIEYYSQKAIILSIRKQHDGIYYECLKDGDRYNKNKLFTVKSSNTSLVIYHRVGCLKKDNEFYCDKCIFQECNKCLIKNYEIRK